MPAASAGQDGLGKVPLVDSHQGGPDDPEGQVHHSTGLDQFSLGVPMPKLSQALGIPSLVPTHGVDADRLLV